MEEKDMKVYVELTNDQLEEAEEYGKRLMTKEDTIIGMELDEVSANLDFRNPKSPLYKHYHKGRLMTITEHRASVIKTGKAGSSPAQGLVEKFIKETS